MKSPASIEQAFQVSVLAADDVAGATHCIATSFRQGEPMTKALGISQEEFEDFARLFIRKSAREGLSVVAKDEGNRVVGCLVCADFAGDLPDGLDTLSPKFAPIFSLLGELDERYKEKHPVRAGQLYHLFMGGVLSGHASGGLIRRLTHAAETLARQNGFQAAIGEATGPVSQHVYLSYLGYEEVLALPYAEFVFEGERIFAGITDCPSCKFIYKVL